jgi:hypothetical protein
MATEISDDEWNAALDALVGELLLNGRVASPPVDALRLAATLGIQVAWDNQQGGRARTVRLRGDPSILLHADPRPERVQWAVAHEIGEAHACAFFGALGLDPRTAPAATREIVANQLAGRLLAPTPWLAEHGGACDWDLAQVKATFATASHELLARRMLDPGVHDAPLVISIFDHGRLTFRRGSHMLGGRTCPLSDQERQCQKRVHATGNAACDRWDHQRLRGWPIHEPGWKREILRLESPASEA